MPVAFMSALSDALDRWVVDTSEREWLTDARRELAELRRKAEAYDNARATVKIEGNTRAYYVLRAEEAEARASAAERALSVEKTSSAVLAEMVEQETDRANVAERERDEWRDTARLCGKRVRELEAATRITSGGG